MNQSMTKRFLDTVDKVRILVVGDLMLDEYLWGRTERISPEAPVPVVDIVREEWRLGGAGNVVNNLVELGCRVAMASVVGDDEEGERVLATLQVKGVDVGAVLTAPGRRTSRKTRVLATNQQVLRVDRETRHAIPADFEQYLLELIGGLVGDCQVVLISDYQKGVLGEHLLQGIIRIARQQGIPVVVDPKGRDYLRYRGATVLTPNRREAQLASGQEFSSEEQLRSGCRRLRADLDLDALLVTRSEEGMSLFSREGEPLNLPTEAREVYDVSGAGDTVVAFLGAGLAVGMTMAEAAQLANLAAGVVVGKVGTSTVTLQELRRAVDRLQHDTHHKILERGELGAVLGPLRAQGKTIVFTNGCFDLLHIGHVKYLQQARRLGDLLVLGLNSDASIRRLKGENRPLISEEERVQILAALDCIDYISIFDEDTPLELLQVVRPQILVKGGDYTPERVVGKELVESYGGRVELIRFVDGKSTTNIIDKILAAYGQQGE